LEEGSIYRLSGGKNAKSSLRGGKSPPAVKHLRTSENVKIRGAGMAFRKVRIAGAMLKGIFTKIFRKYLGSQKSRAGDQI